MPTQNNETDIKPIAITRLLALLEYVEHMARLTERPVFSIREYSNILYFEHELQGRIGIFHDQEDENGPIWLRIERLKRIDPPDAPKEIQAWVTISRDPTQVPQVLQSRLETMSKAEAEALIEQRIARPTDISETLKHSAKDGSKMVDVLLRLENYPETLREAIETYLAGSWKTWTHEERPRRETMKIYESFFSLYQTMQSEGIAHPVELVWGTGLALLALEGRMIEQPVIEALVEIELDECGGAILIRPREVPLQLGLAPFHALENPGTDPVQRRAQELWMEQEREEEEFSPFRPETFESLLRFASLQLQEAAVYQADVVCDRTDRTLPLPSSILRITDTWALYARPRSDNFLVDDLERLKQTIHETEVMQIPAAAQRFVMELSDEKVYRPTLVRLGSDVGGSPYDKQAETDSAGHGAAFEEENLSSTEDLYFPKAFNSSQVAIIRRLEKSEGVVVQGPPGTGKTHTIANVICHYLATGRRVLVTSKGEPALEVLREHIPEDIRDLSISLLTNEREGLRQLEAAVDVAVATHKTIDLVVQTQVKKLQRKIRS